MNENKLEAEVRIRVSVDLDAWCREYGEAPEQARDMALDDLREWASTYYTETKWRGLAENISQTVTPILTP